MNENELRDGLAYVAAELRSIHESAGDAPLDAETQTRFDEGTAYVTETRAAIAAIETRRAQVAELASIPANVERGAPEQTPERSVPNVNLNRDPFEGDTRYAPTSELRERARAVVEKHSDYHGVSAETREGELANLAKHGDGPTARAIAEHIVTTGSPAYVRAFTEFMEAPEYGPPRELRTAMSTTAANGGVLIPHFLDPTINLTNAGANNNIRQIADVVQITTTTWEGVATAGVNAEWLGEGSEAADASPTFVGPTITPKKAAAYLFGSYEMLADSGFDEVGMLIQDAKDRLEETAFTVGNGVTQPQGLITALSGTGPVVNGSSNTGGIVSTATLSVADVYALKDALGPRFRRNGSWLASISIYDQARQLNTSSAMSTFWADFGADLPSKLLGRPVYENEAMDSTVVSGSDDYALLFGDFKQYKVVDRVGLTIMYNPLVIGSSQRPTGQAGWFAFWRVGGGVITSNAFKLLKL